MTKEQLSIHLVIDEQNGEIVFVGTTKNLEKFTLERYELMNEEEEFDKLKEKISKGFSVDYFKLLEDMDYDVREVCCVTKDDFTQKTIEVGIYYYTNDEGEKVYDVEEMTDEFLNQIKNLK